MRDDPTVVDLVQRARDGDAGAWHDIVQRYAALVWGVCRRHGLSTADSEEVGGAVWLKLVESLDKLRVPAALPGWIATTTHRECISHLRSRSSLRPTDDLDQLDAAAPASDEQLLIEEHRHELRLAFASLGDRCRQLLSMLFADPPPAYADISDRLGMPIGGIGPTRRRCLEQLRQHPLLAGGYAEVQVGPA